MGPHSYTKNYKQQREAGSGAGGLSQGSTYQLVVLCQTGNPESIHTGSIALTEQIIFRNMHIWMQQQLMKIEAPNLKESREE